VILRTAEAYRRVADAAWRWVLDQVRWDGALWIPQSVPSQQVPDERDGVHSGIGGLAHVLSEIRSARPWTAEEQRLADAIAQQVSGEVAAATDYTFFTGLTGAIDVLTALGATGADVVVDRLMALATPDGWPQTWLGSAWFRPGAHVHDVVHGTAGVLLGALWARRHGVARASALAHRAAEVLMAEAEELPTGLNWRTVPQRFTVAQVDQLPNFSHGLAGIATALALAGAELDRPDLTSAAAGGAAHLVTLGDPSRAGFAVPHRIPGPDRADEDEFSHGWCHGPVGTSLLFLALHQAGVTGVAGEAPLVWHRRCLHSVRTSGLPARLRPGFWDNDGRCCGTAGVGDAFLDACHRGGDPGDLEFALHLADALVERAVLDGPHAYWQFLEHRAHDPVLPPGVGWQQGAAGIAAFLFRAGRVVEEGPVAKAIPRMDTWWSLAPTSG